MWGKIFRFDYAYGRENALGVIIKKKFAADRCFKNGIKQIASSNAHDQQYDEHTLNAILLGEIWPSDVRSACAQL